MHPRGWRLRSSRVKLPAATTLAEADMADMSALVGSIRRFGLVGPPYEVIGPTPPSASGEVQMRIRLLESGEEASHPVAEIVRDPEAD